ncbi:hypothetical protein ACJJTC_017327 [Scirpophaga incertulas]
MTSASSEIDRMSSKEYKELYVKRSSIKGQLTKYKNYLSIVTQKGELTTLELTELALKLGKLETLSLKFDDLQSEIEVLNSDNLQRELDERENIEHEFVTSIASGRRLLDNLKRFEGLQKRDSFYDADGNCSFEEKGNPGIKLPQIQIAKFDDMARELNVARFGHV